jgi:glycosyltransferase involved in cell wall biosynthesis
MGKKYKNEKKFLVSVITPTIGRPELRRCIMSVFNQSYKNIQHIIVVDGEHYRKQASKVIRGLSKRIRDRLDIVYLPYSTGLWGGCIYAAFPSIARGDYIVNCDDDNWFEKNHVESLLKTIGSYQWAYSLRNIAHGKCIIREVCESLGYLHPVWDLLDEHHIATTCYFLPRKVALRIAPLWYYKEQFGNDRQVYRNLQRFFPRYICTKKHTVNSQIGSDMINFFLEGTKWMRNKYGKSMPWKKRINRKSREKK